MENILFSSKIADKINHEVADKIAHHLILCIHYQPTLPYACSSDGEFIYGVLNLYKLLIDCGILGKIDKLKCYGNLDRKYYRYRTEIRMLRTCFAHNINEINDVESYSLQYHEWLSKNLYKDEITQSEDYDSLLKSIEKMGEDLGNIILRFIDSLSKSKNITQISDAIENLWIREYYEKENGKKIIKKQMWNLYIVNHTEMSISRKWFEINSRLTKWCEDYYKKELPEIERFERILPAIKKDNADTAKELESKCERERAKIAAAEINARKKEGYLNLYIEEVVKEKIPAEIKRIKSDKGRNILPEDMIQEILNRDFKGI